MNTKLYFLILVNHYHQSGQIDDVVMQNLTAKYETTFNFLRKKLLSKLKKNPSYDVQLTEDNISPIFSYLKILMNQCLITFGMHEVLKFNAICDLSELLMTTKQSITIGLEKANVSKEFVKKVEVCKFLNFIDELRSNSLLPHRVHKALVNQYKLSIDNIRCESGESTDILLNDLFSRIHKYHVLNNEDLRKLRRFFKSDIRIVTDYLNSEVNVPQYKLNKFIRGKS